MPVSRVQTLRSSMKLQRPSVGAREPGELYVNFPDRQLGVVDAGKSPLDLLTVRFFSASTDYEEGDFVIHEGELYQAPESVPAGSFDPSEWDPVLRGDIFVGDTPPPDPVSGELWFESDTGNLFLWYVDVDSSQWIQVIGGVPGPPGEGFVGTRADLMLMAVPGSAGAVQTTGYASPGDGGGALYKRAVSEPSHPGKSSPPTASGGSWRRHSRP